MKFSNLVTAGFVAGALSNEVLTPDKVEADITQAELQNILWNFQKIARDNGGNRAFGYPGFNASLDFVLERAVKRFGKHYDTYVQRFTHLFESTRKISLTGPNGEDVYTVPFKYNAATPVPDGITAELIDTPVDDARGSGCFADQWEGIDASGKIALVKRGTCAIADKLKLARTHGAVGVVLYNQTPGEITIATLGAENIGQIVPVTPVKDDVGADYVKRLAAGEKLKVTVLVDSITEDRDSWNIISETKEGDPNSVVMVGAHLDSVPAGPGVNDDGSGSAFLLTLMESLKKYKGYKNKVRFAWWGAEESGLVGSLYYGKQLSEEDADKIKFYFNYDMIASPNPYYAVYADNEGHKVGAKILFDYLQSKGKPATYAKFGTSSDYVAFLNLGIQSSGLFTGAGGLAADGKPADPNYHTAKDDLQNIHWDAFITNAKAAGRAAAQFALSLDGVPPRQKTTPNPRSRRAIFASWAETAYVVEKSHSCSGEDNIY